jgi:hypothetical protein
MGKLCKRKKGSGCKNHNLIRINKHMVQKQTESKIRRGQIRLGCSGSFKRGTFEVDAAKHNSWIASLL